MEANTPMSVSSKLTDKRFQSAIILYAEVAFALTTIVLLFEKAITAGLFSADAVAGSAAFVGGYVILRVGEYLLRQVGAL